MSTPISRATRRTDGAAGADAVVGTGGLVAGCGGSRRGRLPSADVHDRRALPRILFRGRLGWSSALRLSFSLGRRRLRFCALFLLLCRTPMRRPFRVAGFFASAARRCRLSIRRRRRFCRRRRTVEDHLAGLDLVADLDLHVLDDAFDGGRHFEGGLIGFELEHRLVLA